VEVVLTLGGERACLPVSLALAQPPVLSKGRVEVDGDGRSVSMHRDEVDTLRVSNAQVKVQFLTHIAAA
jgi:hypothetical protein